MKTKIAATVGPVSSSEKVIERIMQEGCRVFRVNFSHGSPDFWRHAARLVRRVAERLRVEVALLGDLKGQSIRLGDLSNTVSLKVGEEIRIVSQPTGNNKTVPLPEPEVLKALQPGDVLVTDDGRGFLEVVDVGYEEARVKALTELTLSSRKSVIVRGKEFPKHGLSHEDMQAIKVAVEEEFDFLGLSFVRDLDDVVEVRKHLKSLGSEMAVVAKIETPSAVANIRSITQQADAILIARGDLGMYFLLEEVPRLQDEIMQASLNAGKPVMVATQLLGSMINEPVPTRSEVVDVVNCIKEGADVLMLTGETAVGKYPVEAVRWLRRIIETYEPRIEPARPTFYGELRNKFTHGVVSLAESLNAKLCVYTKSGTMALRISRCRPRTTV